MKFNFLLFVMTLFIGVANAQNTQTGDLNTNTQDSTVDSYNETESVTNNYNATGAGSAAPPMSAIAPSYMSSGADTCLIGGSGGIQTGIVGFSSGEYKQDPECNRRRDAKVLNDLGMTVAAIALMCEEVRVWEAMFRSQSPCPFTINGRLIVGKQAYLMMKQNPESLIPNYNQNKEYYDTVLGIGREDDEEVSAGDYVSISEQYRSSLRNND